MKAYKLLTILIAVTVLANMDHLRSRLKELLTYYSDVQKNFKIFYKEAEESSETYVFSKKTMLTHNDFNDTYLQTKRDYENALSKFKKLKKHYNTSKRYIGSCLTFVDKLNEKMSDAIREVRTEVQLQQLNNELMTTRDTVHDFTNTLLTNPKLGYILSKGPNFIPTDHSCNAQDEIKMTKITIIQALDKFSMKISKSPMYKYCKNLALALNLNHPDFKGDNLLYVLDILDGIATIDNFEYSRHLDVKNLHKNDLAIIHDMAKDSNIVINTADKNLGFTIYNIEWYINEYNRQLSDNDVYEELPLTQINNIVDKGKQELLLIYNKYANETCLDCYKLSILKNRIKTDIKLPTLNIMPKVHKLKERACSKNEYKLKGRPIVNGFATLNTEPSKLLGEMFRKHLNTLIELFKTNNIHCPVVDGSRKVIDRLNSISMKKYDLNDVYFIAFDFSSLYTSIKKWTVFDMIHFLGAILKLDKTEIYLMKDLFRYIKEYAYFSVGNTKLYLQKEGFAMGSYDSGDGANLVLLKSEYFMLQDRKIVDHVIDFFRFIDDGSMIVILKHYFLNTFLKQLISYYP